MSQGERKAVNPNRMWLLGLAIVAGLAWWQWPDIADYSHTVARNNAEKAERDASLAKYEAGLKAGQDAQKERIRQAGGPKAAIDRLMAKGHLSDDERSDLSEALEEYVAQLGPDTVDYDYKGNPKYSGPQAKRLLNVYWRTQGVGDRPPTVDELNAAAVAAVGSKEKTSTPSPASSWHTIAHFTGRSIKDTARFAVSAEEWRVRWKAQGDGNFQVYVYGNDRVQVAANVRGSDSDESYMHGAGSYYLSFNASERYEVWVEAP